jgi:hypothetical protein
VADREVPHRIAVTIALGTLLNPLNSSMIAVALVDLQREFGVSLATSTWLISGFYLTASVGQPLMGRLADRYGPRRVFSAGLALVGATCTLVLVSPGFAGVLTARVLQAVGTSVGFPAGLALIRRLAGGRPPAATLGVISAANSASAAFGPVLGGLLVAAFGWRGIFAVNIPLAAAGLTLARRWLPPDPPVGPPADTRAFLRDLDLPGVALFAVTIAALLGFLLSATWPLLPVVPVAAALFVWHELRAPSPFLDLRALAAHKPLVGVLGQQVAAQCVFYLIFFSLPQWLESVRGYPAAATGLIMLPIAAFGVLLTPAAAGVVRRFGAGLSVLVGSVGLVVGGVLLWFVGEDTGAAEIIAIGVVIGLPNAFNNLGLQAGLYAAAPAALTGTAAGLFQTGRYVGAILSTALLGVVYAGTPSTAGLHRTGLFVAVSAVLLAGAALLTPAPGGRHRAPPASRSAPGTTRPAR